MLVAVFERDVVFARVDELGLLDLEAQVTDLIVDDKRRTRESQLREQLLESAHPVLPDIPDRCNACRRRLDAEPLLYHGGLPGLCGL